MARKAEEINAGVVTPKKQTKEEGATKSSEVLIAETFRKEFLRAIVVLFHATEVLLRACNPSLAAAMAVERERLQAETGHSAPDRGE